MSIMIPEGLYTTDGYGGEYIKATTAKYYWGEGSNPVKKDWEPKAKIPQLETLIEMFDKVSVAIAGGAVLGSFAAVPFGDIDVFPLSKPAITSAKSILSNLGYKETKTSKHSLLYERAGSHYSPVQVILLHTDTNNKVQGLLNRFDLSICQVAVYGKKLHSNTIAIDDIKMKMIRIMKTMSIYSTVQRVDKYQQRGFGIVDTPMKHPDKNENKKKNMG